MADLRNEPFIAYGSRDSAVNEASLRSCRAAGFVPRREHEAPGTAVLLALVAAGLGISLVPASVRSLPLEGVVFRDLLDAGSVEPAPARRAEDSPGERQVVDAVIAVLEAADVLTDLPSRVTGAA